MIYGGSLQHKWAIHPALPKSDSGHRRLWRWIAAALALVLVATADAAHADPDSSGSDPAQADRSTVESLDRASALAAASATGRPVLIVDATTETSESYALPDGQIETTVSAGIVRIRKDGRWAPVDLTLHSGPDGTIEPTTHPADLMLSGARSEQSGTLASVDTTAGRISMGWNGALPEPVLTGVRATYPNVRPDVDLVVEATRTGFEQFVVVKSPGGVGYVDDLTLPLTGAGVTAADEKADGSFDLTDDNGRVTASVPTPLMWDSRVSANGETPANAIPVAVDASSEHAMAESHTTTDATDVVTLELSPDKNWLTDPATVYPVTIDPQIDRLLTTFDTTVMEGVTTDRGGANYLQLGPTTATTPRKARSFVKWDSADMVGMHITKARAYFYNWYSTTCTANQWEIWTTKAANADTRWGNQPEWIRREGTSTETKGYSSACGDGWVSIDARTFFQYAADTDQTVADMGIRASNEANQKQWKEFRSRNAADTAQVPYAKVTYKPYPALLGRSTMPPTSCITGSSRPLIGVVAPKLSAAYKAYDAGTVDTTFEWWALNGTAPLGSTKVTWGNNGQFRTVSVPQSALDEGQSYRWRVRASDGVATSAWSSWCEFTMTSPEPIDTSWRDEPDAVGEDIEPPADEAEDFSEEGTAFADEVDTEGDPPLEPGESPESTVNAEADADFEPQSETDVDDPALLQDPAMSFITQEQREAMKVEFEAECGQEAVQTYATQADEPVHQSEARAEAALADFQGTVHACTTGIQSANAIEMATALAQKPGDRVDAGGDPEIEYSTARAGTPRYKQLPSWCVKRWQASTSNWAKWQLSRLSACFMDVLTVIFYIQSRSGVKIVGKAPFAYFGTMWADRAGKSLRWGYQIDLKMQDNAWGATAFLNVNGDGLSCSNRKVCSVSQRDWGGPFNWNSTHYWSSGFIKASVRKGKRAQMTGKWKFHFSAPGFSGWLNKTGVELPTPNVRCDRADPMNSASVGCVVPGFTPWVTYSLNGKYPTLARHIRDAQRTGLEGAYPRGTRLTRTSNKKTQGKNRDISCPESLYRPPGKSCDEYPFATVREGGASGGQVRTHDWCDVTGYLYGSGATGSSRCMIDKTHNSKGGRALQTFYSKNRILNGDKFRVRIVS